MNMTRRNFLKMIAASAGAAAIPYKAFSAPALDDEVEPLMHYDAADIEWNSSGVFELDAIETPPIHIRIYTDKGNYDHHVPTYSEIEGDTVKIKTDELIVFRAEHDFTIERITAFPFPDFMPELECDLQVERTKCFEGGDVTIMFSNNGIVSAVS